jgi:hypothetical protein
MLACGLVGALSGGILAAVRGLVVAAWLGAAVWWWQLHLAVRESGISRARGRHGAKHRIQIAEPLRSASELAASDLKHPAVRKVGWNGNGQVEHRSVPEPKLAANVVAGTGRRPNGQAMPNWSTQRSPSAWPEPQPASSTPARSSLHTPSKSSFVPPGLSSPSPPVPNGHSPAGPTDVYAARDYSAPLSTPSIPVLSFTPTAWTVVVAPDKEYYDRMLRRALFNPSARFPAYATERWFPLGGSQIRIGRRSAICDLGPEIDLGEPPADPGVSRLHAILVAAPDGTWAVLDPGSANGTLLNGRKIAIGDMVPLRNGDRINLGAWTMITMHHQVTRSRI